MRAVVKDAHAKNVWLNEIPGEIKDVAVRDMDKARKAHFAKLKVDVNAKFKFRSKKDKQESFEVRGRDAVRKSGMFASLQLNKLKSKEGLPNEVDAAVRFVRDRLCRYYIIVTREITQKSENQTLGVVSLDPGVRTFQTTYDDSGVSSEWGKGDMRVLYGMCRLADKLQGSMSKKKGSKKRGAKREWWGALDKIKNKVKEIHHKLAKWLCESYAVVLIPKFESSNMVTRGKRRIGSITSRNMLTWSHYTFRELLKTKAELYDGVRVVECSEAYTSKTCGQCGEINAALGASKTFKCAKCNYIADRDVNGARNIMLRYLTVPV
jgi:putative transposase